MLTHWLIEKKRDGGALSADEIRFLIEGYLSGAVPDYQMSALAMAVYFKGMSLEETTLLTEAMMRSGDIVDTAGIGRFCVDKHSTGGIGDKISLILAPLVACAGVAVPMISGRGLGITGGTLDKLESIPGYRTDLSEAELLRVVKECGCAITGQTARLAPADGKLYALRDVTGTVPSIPLICASILCKKLAEGINGLVLDVKTGAGAFMKTEAQARELAETMVAVGAHLGTRVKALLSSMDQPLGECVGNALEVYETLEVLEGADRPDLLELTYALAVAMLQLADPRKAESELRAELEQHLRSGRAREKFAQMAALQGGDGAYLADKQRLLTAKVRLPLRAEESGWITRVDAEKVGRACVLLGAGRAKVGASIDVAVGISGLAKVGRQVSAGDELLQLHANNKSLAAEVLRSVGDAFEIAEQPPQAPKLLLGLGDRLW